MTTWRELQELIPVWRQEYPTWWVDADFLRMGKLVIGQSNQVGELVLAQEREGGTVIPVMELNQDRQGTTYTGYYQMTSPSTSLVKFGEVIAKTGLIRPLVESNGIYQRGQLQFWECFLMVARPALVWVAWDSVQGLTPMVTFEEGHYIVMEKRQQGWAYGNLHLGLEENKTNLVFNLNLRHQWEKRWEVPRQIDLVQTALMAMSSARMEEESWEAITKAAVWAEKYGWPLRFP